MLSSLRMLTGRQRRAFFASLAGWSLDAFDFFIFVFCLRSISAEFHTDVKSVAEGIFLTLACRPLGALVFGWLAEKYGRRPILMRSRRRRQDWRCSGWSRSTRESGQVLCRNLRNVDHLVVQREWACGQSAISGHSHPG